MSGSNPMRVWIGCLACYNGGRLVGEWFDASDAGDVIPEMIHPGTFTTGRVGLNPATHEELRVFDVDGAPSASLHREMSPSEAQQIADVIATVEDRGHSVQAFAAYCANMGSEFNEDAIDGFEEAYQGTYASREDFAQELADDLGLVPDEQPWPLSYIDWERAARDLFMDYFDEPAEGGEIYVFRNL